MDKLWPVWQPVAKLVWGINPVVTFLMVAGGTVGMMSLLQLLWDGHVLPPMQQPKGYFFGDLMLALAAACLQPIVANHLNDVTYSDRFWMWWQIGGIGSSLAFIGGEFAQRKLEQWWQLLAPPLWYHHIVLFALLTPILGGAAWIVARNGGPSHWSFWLAVMLFAGYLYLNAYWDPHHPMAPTASNPGSPGDMLAKHFRLRS